MKSKLGNPVTQVAALLWAGPLEQKLLPAHVLGTRSQILVMNAGESAGAEAEAKACLLQYLRKNGMVHYRTSIALELGIAKYSNRADLAVIGSNLNIYEIKTYKDTLRRLEAQLTSYEAVANKVTVVAASKHVNTVLSKTPDYIGVFEITRIGGLIKISEVRSAQAISNTDATAMLELMPASEIKFRLVPSSSAKTRSEILEEASRLSTRKQRSAVTRFLRTRYEESTKQFLRSVRNRTVTPEDLAALRIWDEKSISKTDDKRFKAADDDYLEHVGKSFGPVPEFVRAMLRD